MQKIATPNNIENRPLSPEEIEALERFREEQKRLEQQKNASELLDAAEGPKVETSFPDNRFDLGRPDSKLAEETAKILPFRKPGVEVAEESAVSDQTQAFIHKLETAKSDAEKIAIMNEVLAASQSGQIPPNEANDLLGKSDLQEAA